MSPSKTDMDGCDLLAQRTRTIPDVMRSTIMNTPEGGGAFETPLEPWDVVGVGGSEGPARLMVELMNQRGGQARQLSVSSFLSKLPRTKRGLIVFSQGLSPHARMVLRGADAFARSVVVTSRAEQEVRAALPSACGDAVVVRHLPHGEPDSLVRVVGPVAAATLAVRLALELTGASRAELEEMRSALLDATHWYEMAPALDPWPGALQEQNLGFCLAAAEDLPAAHQLMWKWQEAIYQPLPPALDLLAFIHGPFQSIYERPACLLALRQRGQVALDTAWTALQQVLVPERHRLLCIDSPAAFPLSYFYFDACFLGVLMRTMKNRGLSLDQWPGRYKDRVLYELSWPRP